MWEWSISIHRRLRRCFHEQAGNHIVCFFFCHYICVADIGIEAEGGLKGAPVKFDLVYLWNWNVGSYVWDGQA
jgi:hypothetical protein